MYLLMKANVMFNLYTRNYRVHVKILEFAPSELHSMWTRRSSDSLFTCYGSHL